jgi:Tol biopolymer transport system component
VRKLVPPLICALSLVAVPTEAGAAFPGSNGNIAFTRNNHIWVVRPNGEQVNLGTGHHPVYSPDGTRIAFVRFPGRRRAHIWTMASNGTGRTEVTSGPTFDSSPSWSPDGARIVFSRGLAGYPADIYTVAVDPPLSEPVAVTSTWGNEFDTEWSPDGTRIAFGVDICIGGPCSLRIGVVNADGSHYTLITSVGATDVDPNWSPDSSSLVFASDRHGEFEQDYDLYTIPADGGTTRRMTRATGPVVDREPVWSPDGTRIAFVHQSAGGAVTIRTENFDRSHRVRICRGDPLFYPTTMDWQAVA